MKIEALLLARAVVVFALFPALAGCLDQSAPLDRADVPSAPSEPVSRVRWASPEEAEVRAGDILRMELRDCTTNFLFMRPASGAVFLGTTAYCVRDMPLGTLASVGDTRHLAVLIYNSFETMAEIGEADPDLREYNDLALFHLDSSSWTSANPALPGGGPHALADGASFQTGDRLRALARGANVPRELEWRDSVVAGRAGEAALLTYTVLPGAPGTLGGPVLDTQGRAVGVLATLGVFPNPGMNGVARLDTMLDYARAHAKLDVEVATWQDVPTPSTKS